MQFLRVCANQMIDEHACTVDVAWYEAGVLKITNKGERLLNLYALPGITYRIIDEREKLPVIR
jgi:hypothetical protein